MQLIINNRRVNRQSFDAPAQLDCSPPRREQEKKQIELFIEYKVTSSLQYTKASAVSDLPVALAQAPIKQSKDAPRFHPSTHVASTPTH